MILLTGASGYIGRRLLREFEAAGRAVRCLTRERASTRPPSAGAVESHFAEEIHEPGEQGMSAGEKVQTVREAGLLEEIREGLVVEQVFGVDNTNLGRNRFGNMTSHGAMTPPARVPNPLDLAMDPQLVHELAKTFGARLRKNRSKVLCLVELIQFHLFQDESGVVAQTHGGVSMIAAAPG